MVALIIWCFILYAGLRWWFLKDFFSSFEQQAAADDVRLIEAWLIMEGPILHNVPIILILFKQQDLKIQGLHLCKNIGFELGQNQREIGHKSEFWDLLAPHKERSNLTKWVDPVCGNRVYNSMQWGNRFQNVSVMFSPCIWIMTSNYGNEKLRYTRN